MNDPILDIKKADAEYKGFPPLKNFENLNIDKIRWQKNVDKLETISKEPGDNFIHARNIVKRIAAIDTGAIEKLYEVDRGFTWTVAVENTDVQAVLAKKGKETENLIKSQLEGYDFVLDFATGKRTLTEAWIRELHYL